MLCVRESDMNLSMDIRVRVSSSGTTTTYFYLVSGTTPIEMWLISHQMVNLGSFCLHSNSMSLYSIAIVR